MKKILSLVLAGTMAFALAAPTFAEDTTGPYDTEAKVSAASEHKDVTAKYVKNSDSYGGTVYSVTIAWEENATDGEANTLTYTQPATAYTWNAGETKYEVDSAHSITGGWSGSAGYKVTVTNKSNANVAYNVTHTNETYVTAAVSGAASATIDRADKDTKAVATNSTTLEGAPQTAEVTVTYEGNTAPNAPAEGETIPVGTITITLSK